MKVVKSQPTISLDDLNALIEMTAELEGQASDLAASIKNKRAQIVEMLHALDKSEQRTPDGYAAVLGQTTKREWDVKKLSRVLSEEQFDALCPRKPETAKLGKLLEADETLAPKLNRCVEVTNGERLEIRVPPAKNG